MGVGFGDMALGEYDLILYYSVFLGGKIFIEWDEVFESVEASLDALANGAKVFEERAREIKCFVIDEFLELVKFCHC